MRKKLARTRTPVAAANMPVFPRSYWESEKRSYLIVAEFYSSGNGWEKIPVDAYPSEAETAQELDDLRALKAGREDRRAEILGQNDAVWPYYHSCLMSSERSHPRTFDLMFATIVTARPMLFYLKDKFNRPRPSQLAPDLDPIIVTPGHPSYPAGHPFQSRLLSLALAELRPDARAALLGLSDRIGKNREYAGVHYASDTNAGKLLADQTFPLLRKGKLFRALLAEAKAEWP